MKALRIHWMILLTLLFISCDNEIDVIDPGPIPTASFIYQVQTNNPGRVSFASTSTNYNQLAWNFGDNTYAYDQESVTKTFEEAGTYYVELTAISVAGVETFGDSITIDLPPVLLSDFTVSFGDDPLTVNLENLSENADSYEWDFGDGGSSESENPGSYTYEMPGTYTIRLRAIREDGESVSIRRDIKVIDPSYFYGDGTKSWRFRTTDYQGNPPYYVARNGVTAYSFNFQPCELNDVYQFNEEGTYNNMNAGDARLLLSGGDCKPVGEPEISGFSTVRVNNTLVQLRLPGNYIGDILTGPSYDIVELSSDIMVLHHTRPNPFNSSQNETVIMVFEPVL